MKITKVNHIKSAVSVNKTDNKVTGILYRDPNKNKTAEDITSYATKRAEESKKMYERLRNNGKKDKAFRDIDYDHRASIVKKNMKKSIEHQNLVVQIDKDEKLVPAVIDDQEKKAEYRGKKEGLRRFLALFADLDKKKRDDVLCRLRRLNVLYLFGKEEVPEGVFNWKEDHSKRKSINELITEKKTVTDKKGISRPDMDAIRVAIRQKNIRFYRNAKESIIDNKDLYFDDDLINAFWIQHFSSAVERIYRRLNGSNIDAKLRMGYLSEKLWKDALNLISIKLIAIGKAVYHFTLEDATQTGKDLNMGKVIDDKISGLTSFDYEQIKAEEVLQREVSVFVAFATNHIARATVELEENSDFLMLKDNPNKGIYNLSNAARPNIHRNILQFFGGKSNWEREESPFAAGKNTDDIEVLSSIQRALFALRNENFHYDTENRKQDWNIEMISSMFVFDCDQAIDVVRDKYYSNNLCMFYSSEDLKKVIEKLYSKEIDRAIQVPSFGNICSRKKLGEVIVQELKMNVTDKLQNDDLLRWQNAFYFILKEIYYCDFVQMIGVEREFYNAVCHMKAVDDKEVRALKDFKGRIDEITDYGKSSISFPEICQIIMTEQNLQNAGNSRVKSKKEKQKKPEIYKHYKVLLQKAIRMTFIKFLNDRTEMYGFLRKPELRNMPNKESFLPDVRVGLFDEIKEKVKLNPELQKWYILCRLLSPKQANQLGGTLRHYLQYSRDVIRRAEETGNNLTKVPLDEATIKEIIGVVDVVIRLSGRISVVCTDYFDDEDDYAEYVMKYIDVDKTLEEYSASPSSYLCAFCNQSIEDEDNSFSELGVYYDGKNPKLNRNIILSKLYGADNILEKVIKHIGENDIRQWGTIHREIENYRLAGSCKNKEEQIKLKHYQELKNRIEFRDIVEYAEILDELQGQLINWCYLRERDEMYFQLGFHYTCLVGNTGEKPRYYEKIKVGENTIEGAILYQINAAYTNGIPIVYIDKTGKIRLGKRIRTLLGSRKIRCITGKDKEIETIEMYSYDEWKAGMEVFQDDENMYELRNYIDHFHFFTPGNKYSMLDLYSEVFDDFFVHDMKYQKNVPNTLHNILIQHFVIPHFEFGTGARNFGRNAGKARTAINLNSEKALESDFFTYKMYDEKTIDLSAKSKEFLDNVAELLYYPQGFKGKVIDPGKADENAKIGSGVNKNKGYGKSSNRNNYRNVQGNKNNSRNNKGKDGGFQLGKGIFAGINIDDLPEE